MHKWRLVAVLMFAVFGHTAQATEPDKVFPLSGVVLNDDGTPAADATILIRNCHSTANALQLRLFQSATASEALAGLSSADRAWVTVIRAGADGKWAGRAPLCGSSDQAFVVAPGKMLVELAQPLRPTSKATMKPGASLTVDVPCTRASCPSGFLIMNTLHSVVREGPVVPYIALPAGRLQRVTLFGLPPGHHVIDATRALRANGEDTGHAAITLVGGAAARIAIDMKATGSGKRYVGRLQNGAPRAANEDVLPAARSAQGVRITVQVSCQNNGPQVFRDSRVEPGTHGRFVIDDLPPGTCHFDFTEHEGKAEHRLCAKTGDPYAVVPNKLPFVRSSTFCPPPPRRLSY